MQEGAVHERCGANDQERHVRAAGRHPGGAKAVPSQSIWYAAREAPSAILAIVCLLLPTTIAYAKYRAVPGYHTWSVKLGSVLMGIGVPLLLLFDLAWPFRVAALFQLVCAVDELGITYLFAECRHDVPSVFHAARLRRR